LFHIICHSQLKRVTDLITQHIIIFSVFKPSLHLSKAAIGSLQGKGAVVTPNNTMAMKISATWNGRRKVGYIFTDVLQKNCCVDLEERRMDAVGKSTRTLGVTSKKAAP
jgi:hypothetical protein